MGYRVIGFRGLGFRGLGFRRLGSLYFAKAGSTLFRCRGFRPKGRGFRQKV